METVCPGASEASQFVIKVCLLHIFNKNKSAGFDQLFSQNCKLMMKTKLPCILNPQIT